MSEFAFVSVWYRSVARHVLGAAGAVVFASLAACGSSSGGGGGGLYVGGPPDTACVLGVHNEGCYLSQRVKCDPASAQWKLIAACPSGTYCLESPDPAAPASAQRVTQCVNSAGGQDSSTSGPDATSGGSDASVLDISIVGDASGSDTTVKDTAGGTCGDGFCSAAEQGSCPADCGGGPVCGNGSCESGETKANCPADCGSAGPVCGNGSCESGETKANCPADCGSAGPVCGNGKCESGETPQNCSKDCNTASCCANAGAECGMVSGCGNCGSCGSGFSCIENACLEQGGSCIEQFCSAEITACDASPGCIGLLYYGILVGCADDNACADSTCVQTNCGTQIQDCQATACDDILSCFSGCADNDDACFQGCIDDVGGEQQYNALGTCYQSNCAP